MWRVRLADTKDWMKKTRRGWSSLEGELERPMWRVTRRASGAGSAEGSGGGKTPGPASSFPEDCAQGATKADCTLAARGPVTRTMVSRQC